MKKKLVAIIILVFIVSISVKHFRRIETYFAEEKYYKILEKIGLIKRCFQPIQNFQEIFLQEGLDYLSLDKKTVSEGLQKLDIDLNQSQISKIPTITHHIYFTDSNDKLNDFYIAKMKTNFLRLNNVSESWQHFIWTNKPEIFPEKFLELKGVQFKNINEFKEHPLFRVLLDTLQKGKKSKAFYSEASDTLRFMAVQQYGGIYQDMDYEIYNPEVLYSLMKNFDFIGGREKTTLESYYGSAFLAAKKFHPIVNYAVELKYRNLYSLHKPQYIEYPCYSNDFIYFNAPPLLTISYFKNNNIAGNNDIILPAWMIFNTSFARIKNKTCNYNSISKAVFEKSGKNLDSLIAEFTKTENNSSYKKLPIIGADMFCGNWYDNKHNKKNQYKWKLPWND